VYNYWQRMVVVTVVVVDKLTSSSLVKVMVRDRGRHGRGWFLRGGGQKLTHIYLRGWRFSLVILKRKENRNSDEAQLRDCGKTTSHFYIKI